MNNHHHYDWGLRSIRTVLTECGWALKNFKLKNKFDEFNESAIVLQVLKRDTLPKLSHIDCIKFIAILKDVFEKSEVNNICTDPIAKYIEESFDELGLIKNEKQVKQMCQQISLNTQNLILVKQMH